MRVGIIYATHFGYCELAAKELKKYLETPSTLISFDYKTHINLEEFDALVLGGSVRMGLLDQDFIGWLNSHKEEITLKPHCFFLACGFEKDFDSYLEHSISQELRDSALSIECIGGRLDGKLKWYDKMLVKMMSKQLEKEGTALAAPTFEPLKVIAHKIDDSLQNRALEQ